MTLLVLMALLYFLPTLIGHNKRAAGMIFLVNLLTGWTIVGWFATLIWACVAEPRPVVVYAGHGVHYCSRCGTPQFVGARFCSACGRMI